MLSMEQITIREIARICGVGVSTVSRAINNHPDINPETKQLILETIRKYHYVPNNSARNLKRSESRAIAVLVKGIRNPFFGPVIEVIEREIEHRHYSFTLHQVEEQEDEIETAVQLEKEKRLKGIIFLGGMSYHPPEKFRFLTVPFVVCTVDMQLPENQINGAVVSIDDEAESGRMTEFLIEKGHRRIAIITGAQRDQSIGKSRLDGYRESLKAHGIGYDENLVCCIEASTTYTMENGYEETRKLLERTKDFTCIFAVSDTLAIGACKALLDAGMRIPEDVSVAGFDGIEMTRFYNPCITTICQPSEDMARKAVHLLFDLIGEKITDRKVHFGGVLQEGNSVADIRSNL